MATEATVIDAYASLARGLPGYRPRCSAPPLQPFRIDRSEPPRKKRKTEPHLNKADIETRGHHATIVPWLSEAIERARMEHLGRPAFAGWTTGTLERYLPTEQKPDFALPATSRAVDPSASIRLDRAFAPFAYLLRLTCYSRRTASRNDSGRQRPCQSRRRCYEG